MPSSVWGLLITAVTIGLLHTAAGPDHYLPFVVLARANRWSARRLFGVTLFCGAGHVLSSVVIAIAGVLAGATLAHLTGIQESRGQWSAYLLLGFGVAYLVWGIRQSYLGHRHSHTHVHVDGTVHRHEHDHHAEHSHAHPPRRVNLYWWLFIVFVLGPCEALIPLVMTAVSVGGWGGGVLIATTFSLATVATMLVMVGTAYYGLAQLRGRFVEQHMHSVAGLVMVGCASAILFLGL